MVETPFQKMIPNKQDWFTVSAIALLIRRLVSSLFNISAYTEILAYVKNVVKRLRRKDRAL
jgi:hypothetical protein